MAGGNVGHIDVDLQLATEAALLPADADFDTWVAAAVERAMAEGGGGGGASAGGALTLRLVGLDEGTELNSRWRNKAGPTNVLAFPGPPEALPAGVPRELGDLVICLPVVLQEAAEQGKPPLNHLAHLVVHGTLHLVGYTHDEEREAARMEALETRILAALGIPDPYVVK